MSPYVPITQLQQYQLTSPYFTFPSAYYLEANHRHHSIHELFFDQFLTLPSIPLLLYDKCF